MAKYQKDLTLADVAAKRSQTVEELVNDWAVTTIDDLAKRCKREGVEFPKDFTFSRSATKETLKEVEKPTVKNALVDLSKESEEVVGKKTKKGKLTLDEPSASDEHVGVVANVPSGSKDPT